MTTLGLDFCAHGRNPRVASVATVAPRRALVATNSHIAEACGYKKAQQNHPCSHSSHTSHMLGRDIGGETPYGQKREPPKYYILNVATVAIVATGLINQWVSWSHIVGPCGYCGYWRPVACERFPTAPRPPPKAVPDGMPSAPLPRPKFQSQEITMAVPMAVALCRRANPLSGSPDQLSGRLDEALVSNARASARGAKSERGYEIEALRHRLVELFAERHGWRPSRAEFTPAVLARSVGHGGRDRRAWPYHMIDHPYYFRTPHRRAAALAAHLFGMSPQTQQLICEWAERAHLRVMFPTDFPSWWVPGGTTLCVYLPAEEARMPTSV